MALLTLFILSFGCKSTQQGASRSKSTQVNPGSEFLAEAIGRIASASEPFIVSYGAGDPLNPNVIPSIIDESAGTIRFDLSRYASLFPEPGSLDRLTKALVFPLPQIPPGNPKTLGTPLFDLAFSQSLSHATFDPYLPQQRYGFCQQQNFSPTVQFYFPGKPAGRFNCTMFLRQAKSKLTLSTFEFAAVFQYTRSGYAILNQMLRQRRFGIPQEDPTLQPAQRLDGEKALSALAVISAMNKIDPVMTLSYRGAKELRKTCREGSEVISNGRSSSRDELVKQFCASFEKDRVFQDCGFASSAKNYDTAARFADIGLNKNAAHFGYVMQIESSAGREIGLMSKFPWEEEVLFPPGAEFHFKAGTATVALLTGKSQSSSHPQESDFEIVPCGNTLTPEQLSRLSHFRWRLTD